MSDTYRAVYDLMSERISGRDVFDAICLAMEAASYPHVLMRPNLAADGTAWCALYGDDLQTGVAGFGDTPAEAMAAFDKAWREERTPTAVRLSRQEPPHDPSSQGVG